jgi:hypothetical protein
MSSLLELSWLEPAEQLSMSMSQFFQALSNGELLYFSNQLSRLPQLLDDVTPHHWLLLSEARPERQLLWIGSNGVTAQTHYDAAHNLYVQVHGRKTFLLSPPSDYDVLHVYPNLHPHSRQSQWDLQTKHRSSERYACQTD